MRVISLTAVLLLIGVFVAPWAAALRAQSQMSSTMASGTRTQLRVTGKGDKKPKNKSPGVIQKLKGMFKRKQKSEPPSESDIAKFDRIVSDSQARELLKTATSVIFVEPNREFTAIHNYGVFSRVLLDQSPNKKLAIADFGVSRYTEKTIGAPFPNYSVGDFSEIDLAVYPQPRVFVFDTTKGWNYLFIDRFTEEHKSKILGDTLMPLDMGQDTDNPLTKGKTSVSPAYKTYVPNTHN